jgi:hypothetical protein
VLEPAADGGAETGYRAALPGEGGWQLVRVETDEVLLARGGRVVGEIPRGLPAPSLPVVDWQVAPSLLGAALSNGSETTGTLVGTGFSLTSPQGGNPLPP